MNWAHLPMAGGIYDQDPDLMDKFKTLWRLQGEHEKKEQEKQKRESNRKSSPSRRRR